MKANCATNHPGLLTRGSGPLPELLDEGGCNSCGEVLVYTYDGFGSLLPQTDPPAPIHFHNLESDPGEGIRAAQAHCYDPRPGHWMELDPIGFAAGDANLYCYVNTEARGILLNEDGTIRDA